MMKQNSKCTGIVLINEHVGVLCVHTKSFIDSQMKCDQGLIPESCFCGSRSESFHRQSDRLLLLAGGERWYD
jgi:hypothetical protein